MFVPTIPDDAISSVPDDVVYPCEPGELRVYKNNQLGGNYSAWDSYGTEIVWRLMVAARQRLRWVAVNAAGLLAEIMVEGKRPEGERLANGYFYVRNNDPQTSVMFFRDALANLVKHGFIGRDGDRIWPLPFAVSRCQVPEDWEDDTLLQF